MFEPLSFVNNSDLRYKQEIQVFSTSEVEEKLKAIIDKAYWKVVAMTQISPKKVLVVFERFT